MENREKLLNALIEMESLPTTFWRETICRNWRNALTTAEFDLPVESRQARRECGYYDTLFTEIHGERNAEKAKVRNRRKADRKHKLTPKMRKEQELMRKDRMYGYCWNLDCPKVRFAPDSEPIKNRKYAEGDRINRNDWDAELSALTEELCYMQFMLEEDMDDLARLENLIFEIGNPKGREKLAGFTQVEKESFIKFLKMGYLDTFRALHPKVQKYSFFTCRGGINTKALNKGWRLDYFIINKNAKNIEMKESDMLDKNKYNTSDHIPLVFTFACKSSEK